MLRQYNLMFSKDYKILHYLYELKNKQNVVSITQKEIAEYFDLSRATVNVVLKKLKEDGFIEFNESHLGRYVITEKSLYFIEQQESLKGKENE